MGAVPKWEELHPHPGSFLKSLKTQELGDTELGRAKRERNPLPLFFGKDVIPNRAE